MHKEEAKTVIRTIRAFYPTFIKDNEEGREKARIWMMKLMEANYQKTMIKLDHYATTEAFPPQLARIIHVDQLSDPKDTLESDINRVRIEKADPRLVELREEKLNRLRTLLAGGEVNE
ncbi:hypothetical protein ACFOU0_06605 [Salinicoccus sesuvii]|uniref:Replicative helicase inhibitor G39P N-terminal domain-containing protein n=1 Tax=Salinicoccus sesuvii TaxID=868281 RepID=A0ABV7N6M8_9STAP